MPNAIHLIRERRARRRRNRSGLRSLRQWFVGLLLVAAIALLAITTVGAMFGLEMYSELVSDLPSAEYLGQAFEFSNNQFFQTTRIYDRSGQHLLYEVIDPRAGDRQWLALEQIPVRFQNATISIEDQTFYQNPGYDVMGILRAFGSNLSRPECVFRPEKCPGHIQGGSTITQQLIKNVIIAPSSAAETSYVRKLRESLIAREATERYSKERILEWYLNTNFYGHLAYGVDAAARVYFAKSAAELNLAESALLAAIPQSPGLNPIDAPEESRHRQALVLEAMVEQGYVTAVDAVMALEDDVFSRLQPASSRFNIVAPHFVFYVLNQAFDQLGAAMVHRGGLRIVTTLDARLQDQVECAARSHVNRLGGSDPDYVDFDSDGNSCASAAHLPPLRVKDVGVDRNVSNVAAVVLDPRTGEILSMLGSYDYWDKSIDGSFNVAVSGLRQPGSAFKPFTYLTAFSQGYTPSTMLLDVRTAFPIESGISYVPENYDRSFHGPVSVRTALSQSLNVPAVQVMTWVGVENVLRSAHSMGINTLDEDKGVYGPALTLGGGEVTLLDMTYAFGVFANSGVMAGQPVSDSQARSGYRDLDPVAILRIENNTGTVLSLCGPDGDASCEFSGPTTQPVLSMELAYLMNHVLSDERARIPAFGHPNPLEIGRPAAAKTGTTNDYVDSWTVGYTPQLVTGVWVGNSDSSGMVEVPGSKGAAPIWNAVMTYALRTLSLPPVGWDRPVGINEVSVCYPSGLMLTDDCQESVREVFVSGTEPVSHDNIWQSFDVNVETGRLATVYTPPELVQKQVYQVLPPEAADWIISANVPQPPQEYDTLYAQIDNAEAVVLTKPIPFSYVNGVVPVEGAAHGEDFQYYRLQFGKGLNPDQWSQLGDDRSEQVVEGVLDEWDTSGLAGLYTLQLLVVRGDQRFDMATVQVTVDNQAPDVRLISPWPGKLFTMKDESIVIQPEVSDDFSVEYVEVWVDERKVETKTVAPFTTRWTIDRVGTHSIYLRAVDAAGNVTHSDVVNIVVQS